MKRIKIKKFCFNNKNKRSYLFGDGQRKGLKRRVYEKEFLGNGDKYYFHNGNKIWLTTSELYMYHQNKNLRENIDSQIGERKKGISKEELDDLLKRHSVYKNYKGKRLGSLSELYGDNAKIEIDKNDLLKNSKNLTLIIDGKKEIKCSKALSNIIRSDKLYKTTEKLKKYVVFEYPEGQKYATISASFEMGLVSKLLVEEYVPEPINLDEFLNDD